MAEPSTLISVRSDVAASLLIDGLFDEAVGRLGAELPVATEARLARAEDTAVARLGYLARVVELERFPVARAPVTWLGERLAAQAQDVDALSAVLAAEEPLGKPAPSDGAPTWSIPGPGGHVRHFLALRAVADGPAERKRSWLLGFFVRCCEDAADRGSAGS